MSDNAQERSQQDILDELGEVRRVLKQGKADYQYAKDSIKHATHKKRNEYQALIKKYEAQVAKESALVAELASKQLSLFGD